MRKLSSLKVSIIIPVLHIKRPVNRKRFFMPRYTIKECLADIKKHVELDYEVIIVCNGQDKDLVKYIQESEVVTRYCVNSENVGVSRSWNMGAQMATGNVFCFLNDDVSIGRGALERLCEELAAADDVGEVGPEGSQWRGGQHERFVGTAVKEDADAISGFCFVVYASLFHQLGGIDIAYTPAGFEEIDFSFAVRRSNLRCVVVPGLEIHHYHHHGVSAQRTKINYLGETVDTVDLHARNKDYFIRKWGIEE